MNPMIWKPSEEYCKKDFGFFLGSVIQFDIRRKGGM
jgi:hypothetical protein